MKEPGGGREIERGRGREALRLKLEHFAPRSEKGGNMKYSRKERAVREDMNRGKEHERWRGNRLPRIKGRTA